jgi:hypothetical protein
MTAIPYTHPEYRPIQGPRWFPKATVGDIQSDGHARAWMVVRIADGGRTLHWETCTGPLRGARTEATPVHPDYPSDEAVLAAAREQRRRLQPRRL